jgi:Holliday junction DNA helicase RuvB
LLLVDEFHGMGKLAAEELLLVLDEGVLNVNCRGNAPPIRLPVVPFTLLAATTQPSSVSPPLRQRFGLTFRFDFYSAADMRIIVRNMADRLGITFDAAVCDGIARRSLGVPRIGLRLVERVRDVAQARRLTSAGVDELRLAMRIEGIDHFGLRREDRHLLRVMAEAEPRPVSARNLAMALGVGVDTILEVIEPTLVRLSLMIVGAGGRRITERGLAHLQTVGEEGSV